MFGCSAVGVFVTCLFALGSRTLLCCAHKRIVNIMKVYIERNNMQVELIRFREKVDFIHVYVCESHGSMYTSYSLDGSTHRLTALKVNVLNT